MSEDLRKEELVLPTTCPEGLECSGDGSDCVGEYRCKEPDTVSLEELKVNLENDGYYSPDGFGLLNHLRKQHPNGIKWGE